MEKQKGETAKEADPWWYVYDGLNLEGKCINSYCTAYSKQVLTKFGFGEWDNVYEISIPCPICNEKTEGPWEPWFYQCEYKCHVTYKDCDEELKKKGDVKDGDYHHYDIKKDIIVNECKVKTWALKEKDHDKEEKKEKNDDKDEEKKEKEKKEEDHEKKEETGKDVKTTCACACLVY